MAAAASPREIQSRNPADPTDQVAVVAPSGGIEVDRAVTAAQDAAEWRRLTAPARGEALGRAAAAVERSAAGLADLIRREVGKPIVEARGEVARTVAILRYHAGAASTLTARPSRPRTAARCSWRGGRHAGWWG